MITCLPLFDLETPYSPRYQHYFEGFKQAKGEWWIVLQVSNDHLQRFDFLVHVAAFLELLLDVAY